MGNKFDYYKLFNYFQIIKLNSKKMVSYHLRASHGYSYFVIGYDYDRSIAQQIGERVNRWNYVIPSILASKDRII